jgi:hypothetical protein
MADLDLAPGPVASPPAVAPASPSAPASPAAPISPAKADPDAEEEEKKTVRPTATPSRAAAGTTATSAPLGAGLIPGIGTDDDESSAVTSSAKALQPLGTRTMTASAEDPIDTGLSLGDKISEVADECTETGKSCRSSFNQNLGVGLGTVGECLFLGHTPWACTNFSVGVIAIVGLIWWYLHRRKEKKRKHELDITRMSMSKA